MGIYNIVIIIEDTVFQVTEKQYKDILLEKEKADDLPYGSNHLHMSNYLLLNKEKYKEIGVVYYDFRL